MDTDRESVPSTDKEVDMPVVSNRQARTVSALQEAVEASQLLFAEKAEDIPVVPQHRVPLSPCEHCEPPAETHVPKRDFNDGNGGTRTPVVFSQHAKLLRVRSGKWLDRAWSDGKLLGFGETGTARCIMRRRNTLKIVDFIVVKLDSYNVLTPKGGTDTCVEWTAFDFSAGEAQEEYCALEHVFTKLARKFHDAFAEASLIHEALFDWQMKALQLVCFVGPRWCHRRHQVVRSGGEGDWGGMGPLSYW